MAEKEYIELGKVIDLLEWDNDIEKWVMSDGGFLMLLPADVVEVRHGEWVQNPYCKRIFYCSECGRTVEDGSYNPNPSEHFPYCHCGAKMDGKKCVPRTEATS